MALHPTTISGARDIMLPAIYELERRIGIRMVLQADFARDCLSLCWESDGDNYVVYNFISRKDIENRNYYDIEDRVRRAVGLPLTPADPTQFTLSELEEAHDLIESLKEG